MIGHTRAYDEDQAQRELADALGVPLTSDGSIWFRDLEAPALAITDAAWALGWTPIEWHRDGERCLIERGGHLAVLHYDQVPDLGIEHQMREEEWTFFRHRCRHAQHAPVAPMPALPRGRPTRSPMKEEQRCP